VSATLRTILIILDLLVLNLSIVAALQFGRSGTQAVYLLIFSNMAWLFLIMVSTPYNLNKGWTVSKILKSQSAFLFIHLLVVASLILLYKQNYSILQIVLIYVLFFPAFFLMRILALFLRKFSVSANIERNYILIGRNELSSEIRKFFLLNPDSGYKFQGYFDFTPGDFSLAELQRICIDRDVHEIYCCASDTEKNDLRKLVNFGLDSLIRVKIMVNLNPDIQSIQLEQLDRLPGMDLVAVPLDEERNQMLKRLLDLLLSLPFAILILSWLVPLVGIIIILDSPGPIFFSQQRNGRGNKPFGCLKFRTMRVNADADSRQATRQDERITLIGSFLRKTSIDELPQFINVLMGQMSVIGPRPHPIKLNEKFSPLIETLMSRHYVKPGITGLAQCMGYRGETQTTADMENRIRLDRYYIENWTFWLDIKIIFLTVVSLIRGSDKAY